MTDAAEKKPTPAAAAGAEKQSKDGDDASHDVIGDQFRAQVTAIRELSEQSGMLENAKIDHESCMKTLTATNSDRPAYWVTNSGTPTKLTVAEVLPKVTSALEMIAGKLEATKAELETKDKELQAFKAKHNIIIRGTPEAKRYEDALKKQQHDKELAKQKGKK